MWWILSKWLTSYSEFDLWLAVAFPTLSHRSCEQLITRLVHRWVWHPALWKSTSHQHKRERECWRQSRSDAPSTSCRNTGFPPGKWLEEMVRGESRNKLGDAITMWPCSISHPPLAPVCFSYNVLVTRIAIVMNSSWKEGWLFVAWLYSLICHIS